MTMESNPTDTLQGTWAAGRFQTGSARARPGSRTLRLFYEARGASVTRPAHPKRLRAVSNHQYRDRKTSEKKRRISARAWSQTAQV